jgi:hypothetical protein
MNNSLRGKILVGDFFFFAIGQNASLSFGLMNIQNELTLLQLYLHNLLQIVFVAIGKD